MPTTFLLRDVILPNVHFLLLNVKVELCPQKGRTARGGVFSCRPEGPENGQPAVRDGILVISREMATKGVVR
ncbi:hypothetical protein ABZT02_02660 [Streptomyces sp. NPDC005402]|uniref:hypothetical protein n=1 Tax=Streptomyces sp. NPDC005402 TaxID=3155338 RepID=UPI0033B34467